ncbi:hypothetical protein [Tissierella sp.]|uniref:hypothetical protein n=1 Tax=Tissierella sp. TaxID=41274 RepID=UPI0028AE6C86|nr:hypothetical protein [Tissierella sp.]
MSLEKLEKKVEERVVKIDLKDYVKTATIDTDKIIEEIQRNYRLISNTNKRIEKQNQYIEDKINIILNLLKYKEVDTDELKRLQEIEELENRLKQLKREV